MTTTTGFSAFDRFVAELHEHLAAPTEGEERWQGTVPILRKLIGDSELADAAREWQGPDGGGNLVLYEDPQYGFVVNALVKEPRGSRGNVHDHGIGWTVYGCLFGAERITRYERLDDGGQTPATASLRETEVLNVTPGDIDLVPPWVPHTEANGDGKTVAIVLRSNKPGTFVQNRFNLHTGDVEQSWGPRQVPFDLAAGVAR